MGKFSASVNDWTKEVQVKSSARVRAAARIWFVETVQRTPVGNPDAWKNPKSAPKGYVGGRLKNNWQISNDTPIKSTLSGVDGTGGRATGEILAHLKSIDNMDDIEVYLTNNLDYAEAVEEGHSTQAPEGMVRLALLHTISKLKKKKL